MSWFKRFRSTTTSDRASPAVAGANTPMPQAFNRATFRAMSRDDPHFAATQPASPALFGPDGARLNILAVERQMMLLDRVREGLRKDEFCLHYQPKLDVRSGTVQSVEALLRWEHPDYRHESIGEIVSLCEQAGDIEALTDWSLSAAARDLAALTEQGVTLNVSVNLSGSVISAAGAVEKITGRLLPWAERVTIEITETSIMHSRGVATRNLRDLVALGFRLSLDDYGAGYSSLAQIQDLPLHELKIDRSFITELAKSHRAPLIVRSTIDLAHALELDVVAEGIEDAETQALLTVMGCDLIQGFHFARPMPLEELVSFVSRERFEAVTPMPLLFAATD